MNTKIKKNYSNLSIIIFVFTFILSNSLMAAILEPTFHTVLNRLEALYKDQILKETGRHLVISRIWNYERSFLVDSSLQLPNKSSADITITGLLPKHPAITEDGFALLVCHELGHHLGGFPKQPQILVRWSSVEGQADYWAVQKCLRHYFEKYPKSSSETILNSHKELCEQQFPQREDQLVCIRLIRASYSLATYFNQTTTSNLHFTNDQVDTSRVALTKIKYGSPLCRFNTFIAGALCHRSSDDESVCSENEIGHRPLCWFSP